MLRDDVRLDVKAGKRWWFVTLVYPGFGCRRWAARYVVRARSAEGARRIVWPLLRNVKGFDYARRVELSISETDGPDSANDVKVIR